MIDFTSLFQRKKPLQNEKQQLFEQRCTRLVERLSDIRAAFDLAPDDDTTDALIYEENAVLCRLAALYKQARAEGISLEIYERNHGRRLF